MSVFFNAFTGIFQILIPKKTMSFEPGRIAFNLAAFSFMFIGALQLYAKQILIGRPSIQLVEGPLIVAMSWVTGTLLIVVGVLAMIRKSSLPLAVVAAMFIVGYCVLPNLWLLINGDVGMALTGFGKGISLAAGLLVLAKASQAHGEKLRGHVIVLACVCAFGFFFVASGVQHFLFADFVATLIPSLIPFPIFWTYAAGVFLIISGLCLLTGFKRSEALVFSSLMVLSWVLLLHLPRALFIAPGVNEWTALFEAIAFASLPFLLFKRAVANDKLYVEKNTNRVT
jgi:uncharacterized membrane protein